MRIVRPQAAVAWLAAAAFAAAGAWAQSKTTGAVNGRVTDASGAALPVLVTVTRHEAEAPADPSHALAMPSSGLSALPGTRMSAQARLLSRLASPSTAVSSLQLRRTAEP